MNSVGLFVSYVSNVSRFDCLSRRKLKKVCGLCYSPSMTFRRASSAWSISLLATS